jgi:hypothetical protein
MLILMRKIREILKQWKLECGAKGVVQFKYSYIDGVLKIFTAYPGYFIGKAGVYTTKYSDILKNTITGFKRVNFEETDHYCIY